MVGLGDFYVTSKDWYKNNITTFESSKIDLSISRFTLNQMINEPKYVLNF